jgi:hypothetical protein
VSLESGATMPETGGLVAAENRIAGVMDELNQTRFRFFLSKEDTKALEALEHRYDCRSVTSLMRVLCERWITTIPDPENVPEKYRKMILKTQKTLGPTEKKAISPDVGKPNHDYICAITEFLGLDSMASFVRVMIHLINDRQV